MTTIYTVNNKVLKNSANDKWLKKYVDPYNPLGLPDNTFRFKFTHGVIPSWYYPASIYTLTLVSEDVSGDIYDYTSTSYKPLKAEISQASSNFKANVLEIIGVNTDNTDTSSAFNGCTYLTSICLFNASNVTNMEAMFHDCASLTTLPLFDTSNVTSFYGFCDGCTSLTSIPLFDTSNATNVKSMFIACTNVESGALALYQQMSTQTNPPTTVEDCFTNCGSDTVTGAAELAQIPSSWGGTGA